VNSEIIRRRWAAGVDRDERLAETADAWHLALYNKGFEDVPL
jgi:hypothetical protein